MNPTDHEHSPVIIEKEKLGAKGFFYMLFGGLVAGCLSQITSAIVFGLIVVVSIATIAGASPKYKGNVIESGDENAEVAVVKIHGAIAAVDDGSGNAGADVILGQLAQASADPKVKAIILDMDTPGGEVTPSYDIYTKVQAINQSKPVVVYIRSLGASGGYYIASGARTIVANPTAWTGSIGVILEYPVISGLLDKIGVNYEVFKSAPHKDLGSPYREPDTAEKAILQHLVDEAYGQFVQTVADGRHASIEAVKKVADGSIFTATDALKITVTKADGSKEDVKLVDKTGSFDDAVAATGVDRPNVIELQGPGFLSSALSGISHLLHSFSPVVPQTKIEYIWNPGV